MAIDRTVARAAFDAYVAPYDASNPRIVLKVDHTLRVAQLCDRIAGSLALDPSERNLAWLCGLLHDIGRFEQVRRWNTFSDARSCSHAALGIEVLFGEEAIASANCDERGRLERFAQLGSADRELLRTVVATHSDLQIPAGLDLRSQRFCDILRDADKIDILKAVCTEPVEAIFGVPKEELLASPLTPAVEDTFYAHRTVARANRKAPADFLLGFACFAFELVYPESRRIALEQGYLFELFNQPFTNTGTARRLAAAREHLQEWMANH